MRIHKFIAPMLIMSSLIGVGITGCGQEEAVEDEPMEEAGERTEETMEQAGEQMEEAGEQVEETME